MEVALKEKEAQLELQAKELTASVDTIRQLHEQLHNTKVRMGQIVMYTFSLILLCARHSFMSVSTLDHYAVKIMVVFLNTVHMQCSS